MHIARGIGIEQSVLSCWVGQEHGGVLDIRLNKPLRSESASEVELLQREPRRVSTKCRILKKAPGCFAKDPQRSTPLSFAIGGMAHTGDVPNNERCCQRVLPMVWPSAQPAQSR